VAAPTSSSVKVVRVRGGEVADEGGQQRRDGDGRGGHLLNQ
jgi:hypothetical protein